MQVQENAILVIPNNFPAKLWHVVNNPDVAAIVWDSRGEIIIIDRDLIEKQVLCPSDMTLNSCHTFKPITFISFIRQLYAYGFKKAPYPPTVQSNIYQFFHPNFKKSNPELLKLLSRNLPKCHRIHQADPTTTTLPEKKKNEKKDVCVHCEDGEENVHKGILHQQPVDPVPMVTPGPETTVHSIPFQRSNKEADHYKVYSRPKMLQGNYNKSLVPYPTPRRYPCLNAGISNVVHRPGQFVPTVCWYQQDPMAPCFCSFYQMGYPGSTVRLPSMYPIKPVSPFAQRMLCPSMSIPKSVVTPLNHPSAASQHPSHSSSDNKTSTISDRRSPVPEAVDTIQDTSREQ